MPTAFEGFKQGGNTIPVKDAEARTLIDGKADDFDLGGGLSWFVPVTPGAKTQLMVDCGYGIDESKYTPAAQHFVHEAITGNTQLLTDSLGWNNKNLIGYKIGEAVNTSGQIVVQNHALRGDYIPVKEGDKFIFSKKTAFTNSGSNGVVRTFNSSKTYVSSITALNYDALSNTITIPSGVGYIIPVQFCDENPVTQADIDAREIMFRKASILDSTYEPYRDTTAVPYDEYAVTGAVNLNVMPYNLAGGTRSGVAYSFDYTDESIILNNTATAGDGIVLHARSNTDPDNHPIILPKGKYKVWEIGEKLTKLEVLATRNNQRTVIADIPYNPTHNYSEFTLEEETQIGLYLAWSNGSVWNNNKIQIKITPASDTNPDFVPWAMTNRELTEESQNTDFVSTGLSFSKCTYTNGGYCKRGKVIYVKIKVAISEAISRWDNIISGLPKAKVNEQSLMVNNTNDTVHYLADVYDTNIRSVGANVPQSGGSLIISGSYICE